MQLLAAFASLLSVLAVAPAVVAVPTGFGPLAAPYAGVKVLRVPTGPSPEALQKLENLIESMDLSSWTAVPVVSSHVDLEVPSDKLKEFTAAVQEIIADSGARSKGFDIEVMHEDLAASIQAESKGMYDPVVTIQGKQHTTFLLTSR